MKSTGTEGLVRLASAGSLPQLNALFKAAVAGFGFEHFADGDKPASMFLMNWPAAWAQEYAADGHAASALQRAS